MVQPYARSRRTEPTLGASSEPTPSSDAPLLASARSLETEHRCEGDSRGPPPMITASASSRSAARRLASSRCSSNLRLESVSAATAAPRISGPTSTLSDIEREHITRVVADNDFNQTRAAAVLGISLSTLRRKLREYGAGVGR